MSNIHLMSRPGVAEASPEFQQACLNLTQLTVVMSKQKYARIISQDFCSQFFD